MRTPLAASNKKSRRGGAPEGLPPRRPTLQRTPRQGRGVFHLVIRQTSPVARAIGLFREVHLYCSPPLPNYHNPNGSRASLAGLGPMARGRVAWQPGRPSRRPLPSAPCRRAWHMAASDLHVEARTAGTRETRAGRCLGSCPGDLGHLLQQLAPTPPHADEPEADSIIGSRATRLAEDFGGDEQRGQMRPS